MTCDAHDHLDGSHMLKGINPLLNPPLLHLLAAMGHGDELAVVDRNYPAYSAGPPVVHLDGVGTTQALRVVLELLPLDTFVEHPLLHMREGETEGGESGRTLPVHAEAVAVAREAEGRPVTMAGLRRADFYRRAGTARAVVTTGEERPYGCFLLVKGVLPAI